MDILMMMMAESEEQVYIAFLHNYGFRNACMIYLCCGFVLKGRYGVQVHIS